MKAKELRLALGLAGLTVNEFTTDLIIEIYQGMEKKKGKYSVQDAVEAEYKIERKYKKRKEIEVTPTLKSISDKLDKLIKKNG